MVKRNKEKLSRFLSIILVFLMFTYNLPLGVIVVAADGTAYQDPFSFQVVNGDNPIQGATVTGTSENEAFQQVEGTTDQDGKVVFPEITNAEGNHEFIFNIIIPGNE